MNIADVSSRPWLGLLIAPAAWIVQGLAGWWLGASVCSAYSPAVVRAALGLVTVVAVATAAMSLTAGMSNWREIRGRGLSDESRPAFLAFANLFVSATFTVAILLAALNVIFVNDCGVMR